MPSFSFSLSYSLSSSVSFSVSCSFLLSIILCLSVSRGIAQKLPVCDEIGSLGFKNVKLLPDGACQFTRGMGMSCIWDAERGFGERSWRYSCVINDGVVEKVFVEGGGVTQDSGPDPFEVSNVETMLEYLETKK